MKNKPSIFMVVENCFPGDTRVRKESDSLLPFFRLFIMAHKDPGDTFLSKYNSATVFRIPKLSGISTSFTFLNKVFNKFAYIFNYLWFTSVSVLVFTVTFPFFRYKYIHAHNPPDTLFILGIWGKLFRTIFIYDHHDLSPELYLTKFGGRKDTFYKVLLFCERMSCKISEVIISTNNSYKDIIMERHSVKDDKVFIVRNDPIIVEYDIESGNTINDGSVQEKTINILFVGAINVQDGVDLLMEILSILRNKYSMDNYVCHIAGHGESLNCAIKKSIELGLGEYTEFYGYVGDKKILSDLFINADICVEPAPDNPLNRHSTFIKVLEYMSYGKPLVAFDLKETRFSADGSAILIEPNNTDKFAHAIFRLAQDEKLRNDLGSTGRSRVETFLNWDNATQSLLKAYRVQA